MLDLFNWDLSRQWEICQGGTKSWTSEKWNLPHLRFADVGRLTDELQSVRSAIWSLEEVSLALDVEDLNPPSVSLAPATLLFNVPRVYSIVGQLDCRPPAARFVPVRWSAEETLINCAPTVDCVYTVKAAGYTVRAAGFPDPPTMVEIASYDLRPFCPPAMLTSLWAWLDACRQATLAAVREYLDKQLAFLRRRDAFLNHTVKALLRLMALRYRLEDFLFLHSAWFHLHGAHPPRSGHRDGVDQISGRRAVAVF